MIKKGQVSSIDTNNRIATVTFKSLDDIVTAHIPYAPHVTIEVKDDVVVAFFSGNMKDGLIISSF